MASEPSNARSRRTRDALLAATRELLEQHGIAAVTMNAVAERAGVTRRAVYLHFRSRSELIGSLFEHVAEAEGLQRSVGEVWAAATAGEALDRWAAHLATYHARVLAVDRAFVSVGNADPDAEAHRARARAEKLTNCTRLAQRLDDEGVLADGWTVPTAADALYALTNSDLVEALLMDRHWSPRRFADHVGRLLRSAFTTDAEGSRSADSTKRRVLTRQSTHRADHRRSAQGRKET